MYTVLTFHLTKAWNRGDLSSELKQESSNTFKTRKAAVEFIERRLKGEKAIRNYKKGKEDSYCYCFTGDSWIEENTGEKCDEYYEYRLIKVK